MFIVPMVTRPRLRSPSIAVLFLCAAVVGGCEKVPLLAPSGSTITLTSATSAVGFNGTADIIAQVIEPAGTPPHSGTHVTFTTNLGTIQPAEAETDLNGRAVVRFVAGSTSGVATITAISGGASVTSAGALKIAVGSAAVGAVVANANLSTVSASGGTSVITAKVTDTGGNALGGVPITFTTDAGSLNPSVANTDSSGTATAFLTTNKTAKVTVSAGVATTSTGADGKTTTTTPATATVTVTVNLTNAITVGTPTPSAPQVGQTVSIPITYPTTTGGSPITRVNVDWGDGTTGQFSGAPSAISHAYGRAGSFLVVVTGFDSFGDSATGSTSVTVSPTPKPTVDVAPPSNPTVGTTSTFGIKATAPTGATITAVTIDWGDGQVTPLSGNITSASHVYGSQGQYTVTATARDSNGETGAGSAVIVVSQTGPSASFTFTTSGLTATFDASGSTGTGLTYAWDFGDGSTGTGVNTSRTYATAGTRTVRLTVTDSSGRSSTTTRSVTVS